MDRKFRSVELKALLTSQWGDCGLPPSKSPFAMHALIVSHYFGGAYYPVGSARSIADSIAPIIRSNGGDCLVNHQVKEIIVEDGNAKGVTAEVNHGQRVEERTFRAPIVVSDAGRAITFGELVPPEYRVAAPPHVVQDICSMITVYVGLKSTPESLGFKGGRRCNSQPSAGRSGRINLYNDGCQTLFEANAGRQIETHNKIT